MTREKEKRILIYTALFCGLFVVLFCSYLYISLVKYEKEIELENLIAQEKQKDVKESTEYEFEGIIRSGLDEFMVTESEFISILESQLSVIDGFELFTDEEDLNDDYSAVNTYKTDDYTVKFFYKDSKLSNILFTSIILPDSEISVSYLDENFHEFFEKLDLSTYEDNILITDLEKVNYNIVHSLYMYQMQAEFTLSKLEDSNIYSVYITP